MSQNHNKATHTLKQAMITMQLNGCSSSEAAEITGLTKRHLLRLHRENDPRIISYQIGREVIFDKSNLQGLKQPTSAKTTIH